LQFELMTLAEAKKNEGLNYGVAVLPKFKESVTINGGSPIVIFQSTKHPAEAKKLFTYLMNPENMLSLINGGLWMPNEERYYTDPKYTAKWINEEVHTADYKTALVDYTYKNCRTNPFYTASDISELDAIIVPDLGSLIEGKQDAQTAVNNIMPGLKKYLEERDNK
jgi:ABC-type sugar transport system, periplasmic component